MQYRNLGKSGLKLSLLSYGSWVTFGNQLGQKEAADLIATAYENGVNFFDNAEIYADGKSEILMGKALRDLGFARDSYCVSSKAFWGGEKPTQLGLSRKHLHDACHAALKRLQVDYLDMFFCHRPDMDTPVEETVRAMTDLVRQGKVLYWGTSEWPAERIAQAYGVAKEMHLEPPTMEQPEYNLLHRDRVEREYLSLYRDYGLGTTIWSPLASGVLTGKYLSNSASGSRLELKDFGWLRSKKLESEDAKESLGKVESFVAFCREFDFSPAQVSIAWCALNPHVSTIILGASTREQLLQNLGAIDRLPSLSLEIRGKLDTIFSNRPKREIDWKAE